MIEINITAVVQFINFIVTLVVLNFLLITPIRKILKERKEKMDSLREEAKGVEETSSAKLLSYQESLVRYRDNALTRREELRNAAIVREREITDAATRAAQEQLKEARGNIAGQVDRALVELRQNVSVLAKDAVNKVMA